MPARAIRFLPTLVVLAVALIVWLPTLGWGLPSRDADKYLFGDRRPWTGREILALIAPSQPTAARGADVDADPIVDRSKPVILNDTDAERAAIVRRYRLMSGQPDEFIQFKALSEMAARSGLAKLDPRLYQYGGLWMYPVGAMVRGAMLVGIIESPPRGVPALEFYLDRPDAFGRFYVVARFYSWCWGVVAALAIIWLARRITGSTFLTTLAAVAFMLTPVVRAATHEAKPHLAGAALCLCALIAATRYVETGKRRFALGAGVFCGAAMAMVVSMLLSVVVLPTMVWLRARTPTRVGSDRPSTDARLDPTPQGSAWDPSTIASSLRETIASSRDAPTKPTPAGSDASEGRALLDPTALRSVWTVLVASLACAGLVYVATNPFVIFNAVVHPEILQSNLGNSTAMYSVTDFLARRDRLASDSWRIWAAALTAVGAVLACSAVFVFLIRQFAADFAAQFRGHPRQVVSHHALQLIFWPAVLAMTQFGMLSIGKPAEYARFGLLAIAFACLCGAEAISLVRGSRRAAAVGCVVTAATLGALLGHNRLRSPDDGQDAALDRDRRAWLARGAVEYRVGTHFEPAPWSAPPMNLFDAIIVLAPAGGFGRDEPLDAIVWPTNLATAIGATATESVDWRWNRFSIWYDEERHATTTRGAIP